MKIITATDTGNSYHYEVLLDESQLLDDGSPDPAYVVSYDWSKSQDKAVSLREMALLCELELAQRQPAVKLAEEGMTLEADGKVKKPKG
ncbi:MAG TPA: hypothetical protein DCQ64_14005 [Candidatus Rokubacteria bacterium]|nr:hypothetical protein [Candidatus Rokubacteria bacterium]